MLFRFGKRSNFIESYIPKPEMNDNYLEGLSEIYMPDRFLLFQKR